MKLSDFLKLCFFSWCLGLGVGSGVCILTLILLRIGFPVTFTLNIASDIASFTGTIAAAIIVFIAFKKKWPLDS